MNDKININLPPAKDSRLLLQNITEIIQQARHQIEQSVNHAMVQSYWQIGRLIVEHEQQGKVRAAYGKQQLLELSDGLTASFGKGFDVTNLRNMRRFYSAFPIWETVSLELSWSHYNLLSRLENSKARVSRIELVALQLAQSLGEFESTGLVSG